MSVTIKTTDTALKTYYLDAIAEQLNDYVNPFFSAIEKTTQNVYGKEVRKLCTHGINGGIGAGTEDGALPTAGGNNYYEMVSTLKNLYGVIEISDKAIRASQNDSGAFVNILNAEMEGLIKSSKFNFSRMLFGDGSGVVATVSESFDDVVITHDAQQIIEGMIVEFRDKQGNLIDGIGARKVVSLNRPDNTFIVSGAPIIEGSIPDGSLITIQGSYNNELTGLDAIFNPKNTTLYGLNKDENPWLVPYVIDRVETFDAHLIQKVLDEIEISSGSQPNFIVCSMGVRRRLYGLLSEGKVSTQTMELEGGFKAITYNGIPVVADRFCPKGAMYFLNTNDFALHQLCDWQWLSGEDGQVLKQIAGKPVYNATLVKYAELVCSRPYAQGAILNIEEY